MHDEGTQRHQRHQRHKVANRDLHELHRIVRFWFQLEDDLFVLLWFSCDPLLYAYLALVCEFWSQLQTNGRSLHILYTFFTFHLFSFVFVCTFCAVLRAYWLETVGAIQGLQGLQGLQLFVQRHGFGTAAPRFGGEGGGGAGVGGAQLSRFGCGVGMSWNLLQSESVRRCEKVYMCNIG